MSSLFWAHLAHASNRWLAIQPNAKPTRIAILMNSDERSSSGVRVFPYEYSRRLSLSEASIDCMAIDGNRSVSIMVISRRIIIRRLKAF